MAGLHPGAGRLLAPPATLAVCATLLIAISAWSVTVGTTTIPLRDVLGAVFAFDGSREQLVVVTIRLPRMVAGLLVGSALACAGAIMQAVTNNPLASPGLLGINSGAAFAVVLAIVLGGTQASSVLVWYAFAGAALAAVIVYSLGSVGRLGATPLKLALAGAILTTFIGSLTTAMLIFDQSTLDQVRLWSAGTLSGRPLSTSAAVAPYLLTGLAGALLMARHITALSLGADIARAIGQNQAIWRGVAAIIVVLLAGSAVALAGPVGFVGLVVPHIARLLVGVDYRWVMPVCALGGALLVVVADTIVRAVLPEQDLPVGVTMAVVGAPFFIHLARSRLRVAT